MDVQDSSGLRLFLTICLSLLIPASPCGEGEMLCALASGDGQETASGGKEPSAMRRFILQKPVTFWIRLILGAVFVLASVDKILHPAAFAQAIYNYQIFPDGLINLTAIILPWLELLLGILLIAGLWLPGATVLVNLLLLAFFGALVFNVARGLDVHCGCFTTSTEGTPATTWYLVRDSIFLVLGCTLTFRVIFRPDPEKAVATSFRCGS